ncbi:hypothetical protein AVEN_255849-1 [Araneus ventricosus]|uniref:Uncharacterized protein n=1 Tax=Araneus ventricosus TaxID=182803 RepID=A0A4Y2EN97_ARAVE|nr:hypothetical protein AVEN_255849-1 [Araneus ventricosus]
MTHFIAQKSVTHFTARKVYDHFIAQSMHVPAHHQSGQQSAHMHAAHRFLDIQIISNKLGDAPVAHRATPSYSDVYSQYPPPDFGNSFCLVVRIFGSGQKVPRY